MLNKAILIGRLTKEPELRYTQNGVAVATFALAVARVPKPQQGQGTDFVPISTWGKTAENCANYLSKGSLVAIEGRIQVRTYNAKDGQRRWVTEVVAENVRFLDKRGESKPVPSIDSIGTEVQFNEEDVPF